VETLWQRPAAEPKGIFFIAHGCEHQGTDVFNEVGGDGWKFDSCAHSNLGRCLGLPEEVALRHYALSRGYVVMAVSGGSGVKSCWYGNSDVPKVVEAVRHVREAEHLGQDVPLIAMGASSGGAFVGLLPGAEGLGKLQCIVPQIMSVDSRVNEDVPTLFVHMAKRDVGTAARVSAAINDLKTRNVRVGEIRLEPRPITTSFLQGCVSEADAASLIQAFKDASVVDDEGFLRENSRLREWVPAARRALPNSPDTFEPDESCLSELMNVAWAQHEFSAQYAKEIIDFCEGKEFHPIGLVDRDMMRPSDGSATGVEESGKGAWTTRLGKLEVFEFGASSSPLAIALHGMNKAMLHEFDPVAMRLAKDGYHVLIPNFHSNQNTRPGRISEEEVADVLHDLLVASGRKELAVLLGKSWGGGMASAAAGKPDLQVQKLVLVAPASASPQSWPASLPVALFWAEDDTVVPLPTEDSRPDLLGRAQLFHTEKTGGHRVLPSYADAIAKFARASTAAEVDSRGVPTRPRINRPDESTASKATGFEDSRADQL